VAKRGLRFRGAVAQCWTHFCSRKAFMDTDLGNQGGWPHAAMRPMLPCRLVRLAEFGRASGRIGG
jgi:hypothetical protein